LWIDGLLVLLLLHKTGAEQTAAIVRQQLWLPLSAASAAATSGPLRQMQDSADGNQSAVA
jgi:hypothetical protein